jgi:hypothetical protein
MSTVSETLAALERDWATPRPAHHRGEATAFLLTCTIDRGGAGAVADLATPADLTELWRETSEARLFEDKQYGQWGLVLLSPRAARDLTRSTLAARPADFRAGDLVVGEFLGDADLLVVRCDPSQTDFGRVLVAQPIDPRPDWPIAAPSFSRFLELYAAAEGDKFWEPRGQAGIA